MYMYVFNFGNIIGLYTYFKHTNEIQGMQTNGLLLSFLKGYFMYRHQS